MATYTQQQPLPRVRSFSLRVPILDAYLLREMAVPFFFAFTGYLLFWALNMLFIATDYIINQHAPFFLVMRFIVFRVPQAIPMAFPFASLFSSLLAMGRIMGDNEVTAMRTSGIPIWRITLSPLIFGMLMFVVAYASSEYLSPMSTDLSTRAFYQIVYHTDAIPVEPQYFQRDSDTNNVFYVSQIAPDGRTMVNVEIFKPARAGPFNETLQAKTASIDRDVLVLHDVIHTRYNPDGLVTSQEHVKDVRVGLPLGEAASQFMSSVNSDPNSMSTKNLTAQVQAMQAQGIGSSALGQMQVSLADRFALPFASFIGVLLAVPLALRFGKRGRTLGAALAILMFFIYYLMTTAAAALGRNGQVNPYLAAWLPNVIMGAAGLFLLWLEER